MTFQLRDRPDGQFEIIVSRPMLVGIFPDRDIASRVCAFLSAEDIEVPELAASGFATAAADVAATEAEALELAKIAETTPPRPRPVRARGTNLPAVVPDKPRAPAAIEHAAPARLTDEQLTAAFKRITDGEKISTIAPDFGLTFGQLRGIWGNHRRRMQAHIAEAGQKACVLCARAFTPSLMHPDTCARCSHA